MITKPEDATLYNGLRAALVVLTATSFFYALSLLPLADAIALSFISPVLTALMGALILGERLDWRKSLAPLTAAVDDPRGLEDVQVLGHALARHREGIGQHRNRRRSAVGQPLQHDRGRESCCCVAIRGRRQHKSPEASRYRYSGFLIV